MNTLANSLRLNLVKSLQYLKLSTLQFHSLKVIHPNNNLVVNQFDKNKVTSFLQPNVQSILQTCGFKVKGVLRKRCKDCYIVVRDGRNHILCPSHGRHKQKQTTKYFRNRIILTDATQSKFRQW